MLWVDYVVYWNFLLYITDPAFSTLKRIYQKLEQNIYNQINPIWDIQQSNEVLLIDQYIAGVDDSYIKLCIEALIACNIFRHHFMRVQEKSNMSKLVHAAFNDLKRMNKHGICLVEFTLMND
jgi:hypothetical protein